MKKIVQRFREVLEAENYSFMTDNTVKSIVSLEILLLIAYSINEINDVDNLYLLLSKTDIFTTRGQHFGNYHLFLAKKFLTGINEKIRFERALAIYTELPSSICLFRVEKNKLEDNSSNLVQYTDRAKDYLAFLLKTEEEKPRREVASFGCSYMADGIRVNLLDLNVPSIKFEPRRKVTETFSVTMHEILEAAKTLDSLTGNAFRVNVLRNHVYRVKNGVSLETADSLIFDGVINIQGQVAAGKTVLLQCAAYCLAQKGKRVIIIASNVSSSLELADLYKSLGIKATALVGKDRERHITSLLNDSPCLPETSSEVLTSACLLNAMVNETTELISVGNEPCSTLKDDKDNMYFCPYYSRCPKTKVERDILQADVVVTTASGFTYCNYTQNDDKFFKYALENFDLVICDEIDSLVCAFDDIFCPTAGINEFITKTSNLVSEQLAKGYLEKDSNYARFSVEIASYNVLLTIIRDSSYNSGFSKRILKAFTANRLLLIIKERFSNQTDNRIDERIVDLLKAYFDNESTIFQKIETDLRKGVFIELGELKSALANGLKSQNDILIDEATKIVNTLSLENLSRISFFITTVVFEKIHHELSAIIEEIYLPDPSIRNLFTRAFKVHQQCMPNSPLGNLLALSIRDNEIYLIKHFAYGRLLPLIMPNLVYQNNDIPAGPKVLLLSGTGYIPGSNRFHIGNNVNYVIEATREKREYISNSRIVNCRSKTRVSGVSPDKKDKAIRDLVEESCDVFEDALIDGKRALVIVNSYDQCTVAQLAINKILKKLGINEEAYALVKPDNVLESDATYWNRNKIERFNKRILIAPISVIARGYNIVDETGNAWFDSVLFLVRPMTDPNDYVMHVEQVNGYILNKYSNPEACVGKSRVETLKNIRKDAWGKMLSLESSKHYGLKDLSEDDKTDVIASMFVLIDQTFGRLCRLGSDLKKNFPTLYFVDGSFNSSDTEGSFDTIDALYRYLHRIMNESSNPIVARTLYEPFYKALCKTIHKEE